MDIKRLVHNTSIELSKTGIQTADLDARVLLKYAISENDSYLIAHSNNLITNAQYSKFRRYIRRRKKGEPVAYIIGHKEFYGLDFEVNKNVLIPRPETELLVEQAIESIKSKNHKVVSECHPRPDRGSTIVDSRLRGNDKINIIDIGTGSGCIIISLAKNLETNNYKLKTKLFATDISEKALRVAKKNAKKHGVEKEIKFYHSDLLSNNRLPKKFDLIIANLPYLKPDYQGLDFEPRTALDGGKDGLEIVKRILKKLPERLSPDGVVLLEIEETQFEKVEKIVQKNSKYIVKHINGNSNWGGAIKISSK